MIGNSPRKLKAASGSSDDVLKLSPSGSIKDNVASPSATNSNNESTLCQQPQEAVDRHYHHPYKPSPHYLGHNQTQHLKNQRTPSPEGKEPNAIPHMIPYPYHNVPYPSPYYRYPYAYTMAPHSLYPGPIPPHRGMLPHDHGVVGGEPHAQHHYEQAPRGHEVPEGTDNSLVAQHHHPPYMHPGIHPMHGHPMRTMHYYPEPGVEYRTEFDDPAHLHHSHRQHHHLDGSEFDPNGDTAHEHIEHHHESSLTPPYMHPHHHEHHHMDLPHPHSYPVPPHSHQYYPNHPHYSPPGYNPYMNGSPTAPLTPPGSGSLDGINLPPSASTNMGHSQLSTRSNSPLSHLDGYNNDNVHSNRQQGRQPPSQRKPKASKPKKAYSCMISGCEKVYGTGAGLRYHLKTFHKASTQRPPPRTPPTYKCQHCIKTYSTAAGLRYHMKTFKHDGKGGGVDRAGIVCNPKTPDDNSESELHENPDMMSAEDAETMVMHGDLRDEGELHGKVDDEHGTANDSMLGHAGHESDHHHHHIDTLGLEVEEEGTLAI